MTKNFCEKMNKNLTCLLSIRLLENLGCFYLSVGTYCFYLSNHQSTYLLLQATSFFPMLLLKNQGCFCLSEEILSIYIYIYNLSILTLLGYFQAMLFFLILFEKSTHHCGIWVFFSEQVPLPCAWFNHNNYIYLFHFITLSYI